MGGATSQIKVMQHSDKSVTSWRAVQAFFCLFETELVITQFVMANTRLQSQEPLSAGEQIMCISNPSPSNPVQSDTLD